MTFFNEFKFKVGQISFHDFEIVAKISFDAKTSRTRTICTEHNVSANIKSDTKGKGLAIKRQHTTVPTCSVPPEAFQPEGP